MTFKIKTGYHLLTPETMDLLGSTKSKITKNKNGKNVPHLEITEVDQNSKALGIGDKINITLVIN